MFDFLSLFGKPFRVLIALLLYLIAGAALFTFVPDTVDYLRSDGRQTVSAEVISAEDCSVSNEEKSYRITLQYVIDGRTFQHTEYAKHSPSGQQTLHVYMLRDENWDVFEFNIAAILLLTGIAAGAAVCGTRLLLSCRRKKETES